MRQTGNQSLCALNRFGLGARLGEPTEISDPRGWLEAQIEGGVAPELDPSGLAGLPEIAEIQTRIRALQRERDQQGLGQARRQVNQWAQAEMRKSLGQRVTTDRPFVERLVAFWSNHLCVSIPAKQLRLAPLAGFYERQAIRTHVLGRFEDMVLASARHPAMSIYLDNAQSIGPDSLVGRRSQARRVARGLNENYARELLELHTLGVDGGYTQDDVVELARILTGWSIGRPGLVGRVAVPNGDGNAFRFYPATHEPGSKTVLGVRYEQDGVREGAAVIRDLCRHPSTARFLATKLVRHFVADDPPAEAVRTVERVFRDSDGDLLEVSRSLVRLDSAWDASNRKFRTPQDLLVAALRAVDAPQFPPMLIPMLGQLRHPMWAPSAPKGYPDTRIGWADADSLMNRAEFARTLAERIGRRGFNPEALLELVELDEDSPLPRLISDKSIDTTERIALALGGPAFQWR